MDRWGYSCSQCLSESLPKDDPYRAQCLEIADIKFRIQKNRERATRRARKKIRHACISAQFDRMLTLTTRAPIYSRGVFQRMLEKFIRLVRIASGENMRYVLTLEKHDSEKTSQAKRGSLHAHVAVHGRQDYKLLQTIWNYRVCSGAGFVRVSNGTRKMNPRNIAGYISKYIGKAISGVQANKKSYWISHGIKPPERIVQLFKTSAEAYNWVMSYIFDICKLEISRNGFWQDAATGVVWIAAG